MNRILIAVATLSFTLPFTGVAQPTTPTQMSRQQLRSLIQNAHDAAQYKQLADYYRQQEAQYRAMAAAEKAEWNKRVQASLGGESLKKPNPADSAHRLYDSYSYQADHNADLAAHYEQLAGTTPSKS